MESVEKILREGANKCIAGKMSEAEIADLFK